jgi:hypothetical protein
VFASDFGFALRFFMYCVCHLFYFLCFYVALCVVLCAHLCVFWLVVEIKILAIFCRFLGDYLHLLHVHVHVHVFSGLSSDPYLYRKYILSIVLSKI